MQPKADELLVSISFQRSCCFGIRCNENQFSVVQVRVRLMTLVGRRTVTASSFVFLVRLSSAYANQSGGLSSSNGGDRKDLPFFSRSTCGTIQEFVEIGLPGDSDLTLVSLGFGLEGRSRLLFDVY